MKKLLLILSLFGLVAFANANANNTVYPPPVKANPALNKKFRKQGLELTATCLNSLANVIITIDRNELDIFNEQLRSYIKVIQKHQSNINKGLYNKELLVDSMTCGDLLIEMEKSIKEYIYRNRGRVTSFDYDELMQNTDNIVAYGRYLKNMSIRSLKKYYNVDALKEYYTPQK